MTTALVAMTTGIASADHGTHNLDFTHATNGLTVEREITVNGSAFFNGYTVQFQNRDGIVRVDGRLIIKDRLGNDITVADELILLRALHASVETKAAEIAANTAGITRTANGKNVITGTPTSKIVNGRPTEVSGTKIIGGLTIVDSDGNEWNVDNELLNLDAISRSNKAEIDRLKANGVGGPGGLTEAEVNDLINAAINDLTATLQTHIEGFAATQDARDTGQDSAIGDAQDAADNAQDAADEAQADADTAQGAADAAQATADANTTAIGVNAENIAENSEDIATNANDIATNGPNTCLLYTSPSPRDRQKSRMPSSA